MSADALLVIDTQRGAFAASLVGEWAMPDGDALIAACQQAVAWARRTGAAVIWVHSDARSAASTMGGKNPRRSAL